MTASSIPEFLFCWTGRCSTSSSDITLFRIISTRIASASLCLLSSYGIATASWTIRLVKHTKTVIATKQLTRILPVGCVAGYRSVLNLLWTSPLSFPESAWPAIEPRDISSWGSLTQTPSNYDLSLSELFSDLKLSVNLADIFPEYAWRAIQPQYLDLAMVHWHSQVIMWPESAPNFSLKLSLKWIDVTGWSSGRSPCVIYARGARWKLEESAGDLWNIAPWLFWICVPGSPEAHPVLAPIKHETLTRRWCNVGPPSATAGKRYTNAESRLLWGSPTWRQRKSDYTHETSIQCSFNVRDAGPA